MRDSPVRPADDVAPAGADARLRHAEKRFQDIAETISDWIWETDRDHRFVYVSDRIQRVSGRPGRFFIGKTVAEVMNSVEDSEAARHVADMRQQRPIENFVYWIERPFGRRCCSVTGHPIFDDHGAFAGYRGVGSDITELKLAQERQSLLVAELRHRLKNMMATVLSLMTLTMRSVTTMEAFAEAFHARLGALDRVHDLLSRESWSGVPIRDLLEEELAPYRHGDVHSISTAGPDVPLGPNAALSLALVIHELTTNAMKYGALSTPSGRLDIAWRTGHGRLVIEWRERDGPPVVPPAHSGFGTSLLERALRHDLDGRTAVAYDRDGLSCTIDLNLAAATFQGFGAADVSAASTARRPWR